MPSCLGLYIENNIIKYAKLSKDRDNIKIDSFGVKFYDNINETLKQIVSETYSFKVPISVNLSDEQYTYAELFSLLNKKDLEQAINTEFEFFCNETGKNRNSMEYRRILIPNLFDKDKLTSLYVYSDKTNIVGRIQMLDAYKLDNIVPLPISLVNLNKVATKGNSVIVNIEKNTSVTTIMDDKVYKVDIIEEGMKDILDSIMIKENSYAKAYEICKNSTIYTTQARDLEIEENEYMENIMPVLYKISEKLKKIINSNNIDIGTIYITGLAVAINNIDLYFQENFINKKCAILTPFFINKTNMKLNIKDYIEVNSAISLALEGLGIGPKDINFKVKGKWNQLFQFLNMDVSDLHGNSKNTINSGQGFAKKMKNVFGKSFGTSLDAVEKNMLRLAYAILIVLIGYAIFSKILMTRINNKQKEVGSFIVDTEGKITDITNNTKLINQREEQYNSIVQKIEEANQQLTESYARAKAIPNFLTQIMTNIPKEVQLLNITNQTGKEIKIDAQSKEYEQLGYFIAKIKNEGILINVTSTSGIRQNDFIRITVQGNLPY